MVMTESSGIDRLAEATGGRLHWNDPGMDDLEKGWEDFPLGTRVEIRTANHVWREGTVVETVCENELAIFVKCDEKWHNNEEFYCGCGATVMVMMNTRRESIKLEGKLAELFRIIEIAVQYSGGRLRLAFNEEDDSEEFVGAAARFLKLDGKRLGRDIELYGFMGDAIANWQQALAMFFEEIILPIKSVLPESYAKSGEELRLFGESVYPDTIIQRWRDLF